MTGEPPRATFRAEALERYAVGRIRPEPRQDVPGSFLAALWLVTAFLASGLLWSLLWLGERLP